MIRYDKKLNQEIYQTVYKFNKKVKSLDKSNKMIKIPDLVSTKDLKSKDPANPFYSYNRTDLRRRLRDMKRFIKSGSEEVKTMPSGEVFSKWEYEILQNQRRTAIRRIKKSIKELETTQQTYAGRKSKWTYAQLGSEQYINLQNKLQYLEEHKLSQISGETLKYYKKFLARNVRSSRDKEWKKNFLDIILNLGYEYKIDVSNIRKKLESLSVQQFMKAFNEERLLKDVTFYYKLLGEENLDKENIEDDVQQQYEALNENIDEIIKNAKE